jgi:hypothetical protein
MNAALRTDSRSLSIPVEGGAASNLTLWQLSCAFLAASTPRAGAGAAVMSGAELRGHLVAVVRGAVEEHLRAAQVALGRCHPAHFVPLLQVGY